LPKAERESTRGTINGGSGGVSRPARTRMSKQQKPSHHDVILAREARTR